MDFKKCDRCGCFFVTDSNICPKCQPKENFEMQVLKNYISNNINLNSLDDISFETGISKKNLNRFLKYDEFANLFENNSKDKNLKMNL